MKFLPMKLLWSLLGMFFGFLGLFYIIILIEALLTDGHANTEKIYSIFQFGFILLGILFFIQIYILIYKYIEQNKFLKRLNEININNINSMELIFNNGKKIKIKSEKIQKVILFILSEAGKSEFKAGELEGYYNEIIELNKTDLLKRDYNIVKVNLKRFVDKGGSVKIVKK